MEQKKYYGVVYKITNLVIGKIYIGQTTKTPPEKRLKHHFYDAMNRKSKCYIHRSMWKYGIQNFIFEIVCYAFNDDALNEMEKHFIKLYKSNNPEFGYNLTEGGGGVSGYRHTEDSKQKGGLTHKNIPLSEEHKQKLSKAHTKCAVGQYTLSGEFITIFPSIRAAEHVTGIANSSICDGCKGKRKSAGGFMWRYVAFFDSHEILKGKIC